MQQKMMTAYTKLTIIKAIHTAIWLFFNVVIFYFLYAVLVAKIDIRMWICVTLIALEGLTLALFKNICPITIAARRFSDSSKDNFDIFLPNWLARHNKTIYSAIVGVAVVVLIYRLVT